MLNNSDKFDHLIALAAMKCTEEEAKALDDLDTSDVVFDDSYYRKRKRNISKIKNKKSAKLTKIVAIRVAAAIMIIVTLSCVLISCVPGLRKAIYDAIVKWYDDYFTVGYDDPNGYEKETRHPESSATETEVDEIIVPTYIEEVRKPTNLPEGVWEDILTENNTQIIIDYYCGDEFLLSFTQSILNPSDNYVDNEEIDVTHTSINGNDATVVKSESKKEIYIFWSDSEYSYYVCSAECELETLLKYAESVK